MTTIAIDGPGGAGKSTLARALASRLGLAWLDTGAMYRALTLLALEHGVAPDDGERLGALAGEMALELGERVLLDGVDVTEAIRTERVDAAVSLVAAHQAVRARLVERQRRWVEAHDGGVVEGRDITSVVLPEADLKIYLTADGSARAGRRASERDGGDLVATRGAIARRDELDGSRAISPLVVVADAVVVDSTDKRPEAVLDEVLTLLEARRLDGGRESDHGAPRPETASDPASPQASTEQGSESLRTGVAPVRAITKGELAFYGVCRAISVGASRLYYPGPVLGAEHLPCAGPYILAPVHRTNLDWLIAARVTRRRLRYIVKGEVWRSRFAGWLLEMLGAFPVDRGVADREALNVALEVLRAGEPLVVFPEGTRGSGEEIGELRDGAAYLALRARTLIVPVGLGPLEASMPRGAKFPRPMRTRIVVGEPIDPNEVLAAFGLASEGRTTSSRVPRAATKALTVRIRAGLQAVHDESEKGVRRSGGGATREATS